MLFALLLPRALFAADNIPAPADPARINKVIEDNLKIERNQPEAAAPTPNFQTTAPKGADKIKLTLKDIKVEGSTIYSEAELKQIYEADIGKEITLARLFEIADLITAKYRADGYILSRAAIPVQEVENTPTIKIIEGYVDKIEVQSSVTTSAVFDDMKNKLLQTRPLTATALERYVLLMNDLDGINVKSVITPLDSKDAPAGAVAMQLIVEKEKQFSGSANFDNYGSRFLGPHQGAVSAAIADTVIFNDRTSVGLGFSTPVDELKYGTFSYSIPVGAEGLKIGISAIYSETVPGDSLRLSEIEGKASTFSLFANYPIIKSRAENLGLDVGFDIKGSETDTLGTRLYKDATRAAHIGGSYQFYDGWSGSNDIQLEFSKGFDILGARETGSQDLSRGEGSSDFFKTTIAYSRIQSLLDNVNIFANISAQRTNTPLLSSEEFGYGGQSFGRAYDNSEISGDNGIAALAELRYTDVPEFNSLFVQPFIFYDFGKVWNIDKLTKNNESASSAGLGFRANYSDFLSTSVAIALPLTRDVDAPIYDTDNYRLRLSLGFIY